MGACDCRNVVAAFLPLLAGCATECNKPACEACLPAATSSSLELQGVLREPEPVSQRVNEAKAHLGKGGQVTSLAPQGLKLRGVPQSRVAYYWYKKVQQRCRAAGPCHMGGFTRLLHSGEADELMPEIPTVVVKPLQDRDHQG